MTITSDYDSGKLKGIELKQQQATAAPPPRIQNHHHRPTYDVPVAISRLVQSKNGCKFIFNFTISI